MHRSQSGQATVEYVGVLALLALVLAGAGVAVAAPDLPRAVYDRMRRALCIVGGDVCSAGAARRAGLDPCVIGSEGHMEHHGMTIAFIHTNRGGAYVIERRSDGTVRVTRRKDWGLDGTVGVGVDIGDVVNVGAEAMIGGEFVPGKVWEMTAAEYDRLVAAGGADDSDYSDFDDVVDHHFPPPTASFKAFGARSDVSVVAKLKLATQELTAFSGGLASHRELGYRDEADGTSTVYFAVDAPAVSGTLSDMIDQPFDGNLVAEWRTSSPPKLTLRVTKAGPASGQSEEVIAGLVLADPAERSQALQALLGSAVVGQAAFTGLAGAIRDHGTVERYRYADRRTGNASKYGAKVVIGLGVDGSHYGVYRRLIDAEVLSGPIPGKREDCLAAAAG